MVFCIELMCQITHVTFCAHIAAVLHHFTTCMHQRLHRLRTRTQPPPAAACGESDDLEYVRK